MNDKFKYTKQSGFKVPEGYFNHLEDTVFDKLNSKSKLDTIKNPGFKVPKDYFLTVEDNVVNTIKQKEKEIKVVSLFNKKNLLYYSGIAAVLVLMFTIFKPDSELSFDSLETELVESYISTYNINSSDLATLWNETDLNDVAFSDYEFLDESVEDYILENSTLEDLIID
ncbi:MAG: hypothetical protein R2816_11820 [Flavobacteriaceae bacterium]|nr:hypothetical protein [Flavobacteriaceae bacterium]